MTDISEMVGRLVAAGCDPIEAACVVAEAFCAGKDAAPYRDEKVVRTTGADRTARWRERHKASQSVTPVTVSDDDGERHKASPNVTKRHQTSQCDAASLSKEDSTSKQSSKRESTKASRASQLPTDWKAGEDQWGYACKSLGEVGALSELEKFKNHAADKGRVSKNWNAAFRNWIDRALDYRGAKLNGQRPNFAQHRSSGADFFAGMRSVAEDIARDGEPSGYAGEEIPRGRVEIDG